MKSTLLALTLWLTAWACSHSHGESYADRMGFPPGARVLILHVDDAGMSAESNEGAIRATSQGAANSMSVMMPTPWVPEIVRHINQTGVDAGLHLTLNAEWAHYRWAPLAGQSVVPGLIDREGALWPTVADVVGNATADEVDKEIRAQLTRAQTMGFQPTHMDSHMGALFATPEFLARYIALGIESKIPVMFPGGHNFFARQLYGEQAGTQARQTGELLWQNGLPVLDDLHNTSYGWPRDEKVDRYVSAIRALKPGITMMIMHCAAPSDGFAHITDSAPSRYGDLEAMQSAEVKRALQDEGIILTTWGELAERAGSQAGR